MKTLFERAKGFNNNFMPIDMYQPMYDTIFIDKKPQSYYEFCSIPRGQKAELMKADGSVAGLVKTYQYTNLSESGVMTTQMAKFDKIDFVFQFAKPDFDHYEVHQSIIKKFLDNMIFQFRIVDKDMLIFPMTELTEVFPYKYSCRLGDAITINLYENFHPTITHYETFQDGVLELDEHFNLMIVFDGFIRRPS